ncbi:hypothetical protein ACO2Q0_15290 [Phenylobacterium sp. VNQ135]|uniref:hypothetical protein n=1 Tax=Phenylobacterium sp. VNQ135 TaxID=3400922 RepID=UPI003C100DDC
MGAKEAGEAAGGQELACWTLWRKLKNEFSAWSFMPSWFYTPGSYGYIGVDFLSGFRRNRSTQRAFALLEDVDARTFDAVAALAALNARRQEQMMRAVVISYLTVPVTVTALVAEILGDDLASLVREHMFDGLVLALSLAIGPVAYLISNWRARQIVGVLELIRIERDARA